LELASLLVEFNFWGKRISEITRQPATISYTGEFIASCAYDIELKESTTTKGFDRVFRPGNLTNSTVNVKWYSKLEYVLDINPQALPDYFLVMMGPIIIIPIY